MESLKTKRAWTHVLQTQRDHTIYSEFRLLYPAKISNTIDRENKLFHNKVKFKQYLPTNSALQKGLEGKFQPKEGNNNQENKENK